MSEMSGAEKQIAELNLQLRNFRKMRIDAFDRDGLASMAAFDKLLILGIWRPGQNNSLDRSTSIEARFENRELRLLNVMGKPVPPSVLDRMVRLLAEMLQFLAEKNVLRFDERRFFNLFRARAEENRNLHWRMVCLDIPIIHGDLIVLRAPTTIHAGAPKQQIFMAHRAVLGAPFQAKNIQTGALIPTLRIQQGRAAKLTPASAQFVDRTLIPPYKLNALLQHQAKVDANHKARRERPPTDTT